MNWKPDRILRIILLGTMVNMLFIWLPLVRGVMDGESYQWANGFWGFLLTGSGVRGDYWLLVLQGLFGITLMYLGLRGARQPFHWLLLLWHVPSGVQAFYDAITSPQDYRFRGDSLGVDISLAWAGPLFFGGLALLSIFWVTRDLKRGREKVTVEWTRANRIFLLIALILLPVQFTLFNSGEPHGPGDQAGVILTMLQWWFIYFALFPWPKRVNSTMTEVSNA